MKIVEHTARVSTVLIPKFDDSRKEFAVFAGDNDRCLKFVSVLKELEITNRTELRACKDKRITKNGSVIL